MTVREASSADLAGLAEIERACFSEPWSENALAGTLGNPLARLFCAAEEDGTLSGYAGVYLLDEDADITNVAVLPAFRRQGIADAVLVSLEAFCREHGAQLLHLEVRASNTPALALYEKHGFVRDGLRKNYYKNPKEDAVLMTLPLTSPNKGTV